jgi:HPt (histidine-containing phosphotransfer) domain-containing protein
MAEQSYNLDYLNSISGGDKDFVVDMIVTFIHNAPEDLDKIKNYLADENWDKVGEDAHRFASSLLFLGLNDLKAIANRIEEMGLERNNIHHIPALLSQLEKGCYQIIEELKRDFNV